MSISDHFPTFVESLPEYVGRFAARRLSADTCEVLFAHYPAGSSIETHTHETDNWGVITQGALYLTVAGEERRVGPGEWYEVPAGQPHAAHFIEDTAEIEFWFAVNTKP